MRLGLGRDQKAETLQPGAACAAWKATAMFPRIECTFVRVYKSRECKCVMCPIREEKPR